jgi:ADP-ribose pyrophosphatase YjhB (NUDIX family)
MIVTRVAARVLLVDAAGRVLLFDAVGRAGEAWVPVGGELEAGEDLATCATREVFEETGQRVAVGDVVACTREQHVIGEHTYDCFEHVFVARADSTAVDTSGHTAVERRRLRSHRWWPPEEIVRAEHRFFPADLPTLVAQLLRAP